jgi:hypothetical protein
VGWQTTYPHPDHLYTRGFPYSVRDKLKTVISHGLWSGALDQDGRTEVVTGKLNEPAYPPLRSVIPAGLFFPMSSMNLAFRREITPAMFFPMMGYDPEGKLWGFDRYDDIWAAYILKRIADHLGDSITFGEPIVKQERNPHNYWKDLEQERVGHSLTLRFVNALAAIPLKEKTYADCYGTLAHALPRAFKEHKLSEAEGVFIKKFIEGMRIWRETFATI